MQQAPRYDDVVTEVQRVPAAAGASLPRRGHRGGADCTGSGLRFRQVAAATTSHCWRGSGALAAGPYPLLVGLSRKSLLAKLLGRPVENRLAGSLALATAAVLAGARIVRSHDVAETRDAVRVADAVRQAQRSAS